MKNKITPEAIFVLCLFFAIWLVLINAASLDRLNEKQAETVSEVAAMVEPFQKFLTPTPTATATPTATPTPVPTLSPTPTPICLMSNQEYYNECVARGLITPANDYDDRITKERGGYMGPSGRETYYNLKMDLCVAYMRDLGYDEIEFPYWIRDDGAKMLGNYVMCAANWSIRPKGTILETSLGDAIVVDTGDFVLDYPYGVDLAVDW
jgi:hypothetical protein